MDVRAAEERDLDQLAQIWYDGWHEAHAERVPEELTRQRTLESFRERLHAALSSVQLAGPQGLRRLASEIPAWRPRGLAL